MAKNKKKGLRFKVKNIKTKILIENKSKKEKEIIEINETRDKPKEKQTSQSGSKFIDFEPTHGISSPTIEQEQKPRDRRLEDSLTGIESGTRAKASDKKYDRRHDQRIDYSNNSNKPQEERLYETSDKERKEVVLPKVKSVTDLLPKRRQQQQIPLTGTFIPEHKEEWQVKTQADDKYESNREMNENLDWKKRERKIKKYEISS